MTAQRLWWVRHGPTHVKRVVGWEDVPADLSNQAEVDALANALPPDAVVISSDSLRARQTADAIRGAREALPADDRLREMDFGDWDGLTADEIEARDPDISRRFWTGEAALRAPKGESWNDISARVSLAEANLRTLNKDVIIVAHMGVIMTRIQMATGGSVHQAMGHRIPPLSITRIDHYPTGQRLVFAGRPSDMVNTS